MFSFGSLTSGGTVATFSGPASVFTDSSGLGSVSILTLGTLVIYSQIIKKLRN